ncbi:MAG: adenylate/guanylate cyclase domain-containing protein, partial [Chloroflexi bacterium]|nr:adenylate/guanylate cyclase domain-containing protein [Chloroflexota bacterium]
RQANPLRSALQRLKQPLDHLGRPVRRRFRPFYGAIAIGVAVTLVAVFVLQSLAFVTRTELAAYDFLMARRGSQPPPPSVVFVGVDDPSIQFLNNGYYPLLRSTYGDAIRALHRAGASAIGLDVIFPGGRGAQDSSLARAMKEAGNVVQADALQDTGGLGVTDATCRDTWYQSLVRPPAPIAGAAARLGVANFPTDADGVIRRADLMQVRQSVHGTCTQVYPSFAVQLASLALHEPVSQVIRGLPTTMLINYRGKQSPNDQYPFFPHSLVNVALDEDPHTLYRNKVVIIGCSAIVCQDTKPSPYGDMYGAVVEANTLATILSRDPITPAGNGVNTVVALLVGLAATLAASRLGFWRSSGAVLFVFVGYAALTVVLFDVYRTWINLVTPEIVVILAFAAVMALRFATEERQKRKATHQFGLYVKPEIVDILVNAPESETALAGARRPITVLFVDVRGFTALSEVMEPEDVVSALDIYLEELTESVQATDGTLDKYVGDELMAIWNAPQYQDDHPLLAVRSALDMLNRNEHMNRQLQERGLPALGYGIGVNSGDAVVGNMGSSFRKQYDVIGDTVNTAARLCSAAGRGEIIIGERTWELVGDRLIVEETEPLRLKGKRRPLRTFRVLGLKSDAQPAARVLPAPVTGS